MYEALDLPINSLVEVIGFLSISLSSEESIDKDDFGEPQSIPAFTIYAITVKQVPHSVPISFDLMATEESPSTSEICRDLIKLFTHFLFGDELAANYLLCHLISKVYGRVGGEVLGKFSLNLNCALVPKNLLIDHVQKLYNLLQLLLPDSLYVPFTIENLNTATFIPKKNYSNNRLETGILQLPLHTHLVLDETKLENGKLEQNACLALTEISDLIKLQSISYDFGFYKIPFLTDVPVLTVSDGKSLLPNDFAVKLKPESEAVELVNENIAAGVHYIKPRLNSIRRYLAQCRQVNFEIGEDETKMIEADFAKMREDRNLDVEELHSLMVVSRLIGISEGRGKLDETAWSTAKGLEVERLSRIDKKKVSSET